MKQKTEIAVIGAGHAGIEAALASARMGCDTVLFTLSLDAVANLPCNPERSTKGRARRCIPRESRRTDADITP